MLRVRDGVSYRQLGHMIEHAMSGNVMCRPLHSGTDVFKKKGARHAIVPQGKNMGVALVRMPDTP